MSARLIRILNWLGLVVLASLALSGCNHVPATEVQQPMTARPAPVAQPQPQAANGSIYAAAYPQQPYHGYRPLTESLNPSLSGHAHPWFEMHFQGERDANVPAVTTDAYFTRYPTAHRELIDAFDHACCWVDAWPSLYRRVRPEDGK